MRKLLTVLITVLCFHTAYSQSDFRHGYLLTNEGDTVSGFIDYREGRKNFKICEFKKTFDSESKEYTPDEIKGYRFINDKFFVSKDIIVKNEESQRVFLEVLIIGKVSLYRYFNRYFVSKNFSLYELESEEKEVMVNDRTLVKKTNRYIGVLSYLLSDCFGIREKIPKTEINEKKLTKLVHNYNNCTGELSTTFKEKKAWLDADAGFGIAFVSSSVKFISGLHINQYLTSDFRYDYSPSVGANLELKSPRLNERIAFYAGIYYLKSNYISFSTQKYKYYTDRNDVSIDIKQLKSPVGLRYSFPYKNIAPYINFGASATLHLYSSSFWVKETEVNNVVQTTEQEALTIKQNQIGYWGGVGIKKNINAYFTGNFEVRYEFTNGITVKDSLILSRITNIQLLIALIF